MEMKRLISIAIAFAMLAVSFAMVAPQNAKAAFIETGVFVPWAATGTFTPNDIEWDDTGRYCLVVGAETDLATPGLSNAWHYNAYTDAWVPVVGAPRAQILTSVCWDAFGELFWAVGDMGGLPTSSVYDMPRDAVNFVSPVPTLSTALNAVEADDSGNILAGGAGGYLQAFNKADNVWYSHTPGANWETFSITFNSVDGIFIIAAYDITLTTAGIIYTDPSPLGVGTQSYVATMPFAITELVSIAWNPARGYALAVGSGVYKIDYATLPIIIATTIVADGSGNLYNDVAWDTDGYNEAAIVGQNNFPRGTYWRYYHSNPTMIWAHQDAALPTFTCVSIKPPASPKMVFIPTPTGGIIANIQELDESTRLVVNAVLPKLWWIGFADDAMNDRLQDQVDVDANYVFSLEYSYDPVGYDECEFVVQAWHDMGLTGLGGSAYPAEDDNHRNLAFTIRCDPFDPLLPLTEITYPTPELEITVGAPTIQVSGANASRWQIFIPVWFGNQLRAATGGPAIGPDYSATRNLALDNTDTWDFSITVSDFSFGGEAVMYGEFGIKETRSIEVTNNPTGSAPPGAIQQAMGPDSRIVYSSNADYRITVRVPNLHLNGDIAQPFIAATNLYVQNIHGDAVPGNSDISVLQTQITAADTDMYVWGAVLTPMSPLNNGLISAGPLMSDFTNPGVAYTELTWWVSVDVATAEGIYIGTISINIGA